MAHIGRRNQLGIALEPIEGAPTAPTHFIPYLECTLQERHTPIADIQAKGRRDAEGHLSVEGKKWSDGKIDVVLDPTTAPYWFALALGDITSAPDAALFKHTITATSTGDPLTATIWRDRTVKDSQFSNAVVDSLELSFADDVAKLSNNIIAKYPTDQARTIAEEDLTYYTFKNATVTTGAGEIKIRELTLRIENSAEQIYNPGDNNVDRIVLKALRVSGSFKLLFETVSQLTAFTNVGKQALTIAFGGADGDEITISLPSFRVDNWTEEASIDDLAQEGIDFVAEWDDVSEKTISVEVINDTEEYESTSP